MDNVYSQNIPAHAAQNNYRERQRERALGYLVITALLWSLGGLLIKSVAWNPLAIAGMRSAIALLPMLAFTKRSRFTWSGAQLGGAVAYAATVSLFVVANKLTTAANAILLQYTAPIYVALFGTWFLGEKATKTDWLAIGATFGGMLLFFADRLSPGGMLGNFIAILSGIAFAGTAMCLRKQKNASPLESVILGNILTAFIGLPFMFSGPYPDATGWAALLLLGLFQLGFSYILYATAMKHVTALEGILIPILEPILNPVWVALLLGEKPGRFAVVGGLIVLAAVTGRSAATLRQPQPAQ